MGRIGLMGLILVGLVGCAPAPVALDVRSAVAWPSWTPRPTNTPRLYPSWTPLPTATSRRSATPSQPTAAYTVTPTVLPSVTPDLWATFLPTETPKPCEAAWQFTSGERLRIQGAALYHLRSGPEIDLIPAYDALCGIGLYLLDLGAPMTIEFAVEGDVRGDVIRCRGFATGIVASMEREGLDPASRHWAALRWDGEDR